MLRSIGINARSVSSPIELTHSTVTILPGVGSFNAGMRALNETGWSQILNDWYSSPEDAHRWLIGICLGMQLLCERSEEGNIRGLGLIPGRFERFSSDAGSDSRLKVPHMGWNQVDFNSSKAPWINKIPEDSRFYFVHSYRYTAPTSDFVLGTTTYGSQFASAIGRDRVVGFQFHPEKSHRFGKALFRALFEHIQADGND